MKIHCWVMSKLLSPGGYALWHSLGNMDEWERDSYCLIHKNTKLRINCYQAYVSDDAPELMGRINAFIFGGWVFDLKDGSFLKVYERQLLAGRGYRLFWKIKRVARKKARKKTNMEVFKAMTLNE